MDTSSATPSPTDLIIDEHSQAGEFVCRYVHECDVYVVQLNDPDGWLIILHLVGVFLIQARYELFRVYN